METSNLQMEILQRIYLKKSIWELESIAGFHQALKSLFAMCYIYTSEEKDQPTSYDPYCNIQLTARGRAVALGRLV